LAVKIRLMRVGKKKQPTYRVVVADARSPRDGRFIESIGQYAPREEPSLVKIDNERALHWLRNGAQPTEEAAKLLEISGAWAAYAEETGRAPAAKPKAKTPKAKAAPTAPAPAAEVPAAEEAPPAEVPASEVTAGEEGPAAEVPPAGEAAES
jgi:small subunit ribosomal protein S16